MGTQHAKYGLSQGFIFATIPDTLPVFMPQRAAVLFLICFSHLFAADPARWIYLESGNFKLLTDGGEKSGRKTLNHFEQVRSFFHQTMGSNLTPLPVRIIQFTNEARYKRIRPWESAAAFYLPGADLDMIVMGPGTTSDMTVAVHEYVHVLVQHSGLDLPLWLNEGLAEVYSTLTPVSGKMQVGAPPPGRMLRVSRRAWMPLKLLFGMTTESREYGSRDHAGDFYAQCWAFTHMAILGDGMRERFPDFLKAVSDGAASEKAFQQIYGLSPLELEDKLDQYLRRPTINAVLFGVQMPPRADPLPARQAEPYEYELLLAQIEASQKRMDSAVERCERMIQSFPGRSEPHEALAYIHLRNRQPERAATELGKAVARGGASRTAILHFLRMAPAGHASLPAAELAAGKLIETNPADLDARLALASRKLSERQPTQARAALAGVRNVPKRSAAEFFRVLAYAALGEGDTREAASAAQRLKAELPASRQQEADNLIATINSAAELRTQAPAAQASRQPRVHTAFPSAPPGGGAGRPARAPSADFEPDPGPPKIRYVEPTPEAPAPAPAPKWRTPDSLPSAEGVFESLDCAGARAAMRVRASGRLLQLWIDNPLDIEMKNGNGAPIEFSCGKQTGSRRVTIQYDPMPAGRTGDGLVRSILFP